MLPRSRRGSSQDDGLGDTNTSPSPQWKQADVEGVRVHRGRPSPVRSVQARRDLYKLNAGLIAAPPLDAGLAPRGAQRQQQGKGFGNFTFDRQPRSGWGKIHDAARPGRKAPLQPNPSR
jgi:hypothetical protein